MPTFRALFTSFSRLKFRQITTRYNQQYRTQISAVSTNMPCKVYFDFDMGLQSSSGIQRLRDKCELKMHTGKQLVASREDLLKDIRGATILGCQSYNKIDVEVLDAAGPSLIAICSFSAGYNHIDRIECKKRNIRVGYMGDLLSGPMAEFAIGLMIATARRFGEAIAELPKGGWENWSASYLSGFQLMNSTVGIVGLGNIGQEVVKRLKAFDVKQILYSGNKRKPQGDALGAEYTTFEDLLQKSDFVVATCALNDQTREIFNRTAFDLMKPTSVFINVARGGIVDQEALYEALTTNKIFAAGLDVVTPEPLPRDHPLLTLKNCVILPHIGPNVPQVRDLMSEKTMDNVLAVIEGKPIPTELHL